ncbi:hypothetical protein AVEN_177947-1 [Araneus ventricosus]|uniref:Uncharacterized protein n=1 Tax=Araneus ventricosus TaxID=182803 RepID=A0A4Y2S9N7_ARAVE|nr:hypothetical protein AVEN_177947-1 [Araneus ventricosus]
MAGFNGSNFLEWRKFGRLGFLHLLHLQLHATPFLTCFHTDDRLWRGLASNNRLKLDIHENARLCHLSQELVVFLSFPSTILGKSFTDVSKFVLRHRVWENSKSQTYSDPYSSSPTLRISEFTSLVAGSQSRQTLFTSLLSQRGLKRPPGLFQSDFKLFGIPTIPIHLRHF